MKIIRENIGRKQMKIRVCKKKQLEREVHELDETYKNTVIKRINEGHIERWN